MIQRVAVVGAGTMGAGIAQLCAQAGFSVKVHDPLPAALAALPAKLRKALDAGVLRGRLTTQQADRAYHSVSPAPALEDLAGAELVLEAAPEDLALKQDLFARLSVICPDAILATNTSSLSVARIMERAEVPERALGVHFFNPPVAMRLVEMVRAEKTSPAVFQAAWDFMLTALKQDLFSRLSVICPDAILATNTSSLSVARIMERAELPERALGVHFFNPPVAMRLVEMVRADKTSPAVFQAAWDFMLTALKRVPVDVKDVPGFIVNRVMRPYYVTGQRLASPASGFAAIDDACRAAGVPMGPFELMDLIGLDTNLSITKSIHEALGRPERFAPPALQQSLVDAGALGRKAGRGFYLYVDGKKGGENPEALAALKPGAGSAPWPALRAALIAEAELVVSEGTASASDVDSAIKLAMNFPQGPFEWRNENTAAPR